MANLSASLELPVEIIFKRRRLKEQILVCEEEDVLVFLGVQAIAHLSQAGHLPLQPGLDVVLAVVVDGHQVLDVVVVGQVQAVHQLGYFLLIVLANTDVSSLGAQDIFQL